MKKPKILYRFSCTSPGPDLKKRANKHKTGEDCAPQIVDVDYPHGRLWRCRHDVSDFYGYEKMLEAKAEEISNTKTEIHQQKAWLAKLLKI